ncbi:hypothetical protein GCM10010156_49240 [Planobispora rosea]|uniref:Uncharacterized protein n=1 Tax=Planobispora rosea TaxID=35762 RepID=A0A8J3WEI7_PLARO|nr:DUF4192 family protein [Planobispora rosea]GGS84754.1 hypothetical protein GCM10010156_49240 [Planobispora rosea]GIH86435.1 hypothetical protein Pro02_48430 [Planobispora rosea]
MLTAVEPLSLSSTAVYLADPDAALSLVRRLFGSHPRHSVVALGFSGPRPIVVVSARLPAAVTELVALAEQTTYLLGQYRSTDAVLVGYGAGAPVGATLIGLHRALESDRIIPAAAVHYQQGHYQLPLCPEPGECCPTEATMWDSSCGDAAATALLQTHVPAIHTIYPARGFLRSIRRPRE